MMTHSKPIGNSTQPIARNNAMSRRTRRDRRPTTRRPIVTAPAVDPETAQHAVRYSTATPNVTTVENTAFSDGRLKAAGEYTSRVPVSAAPTGATATSVASAPIGGQQLQSDPPRSASNWATSGSTFKR